ncbi:MAG: Smr/MutS family protein [Parcubacteria group bacterium]|nr:Smr/MutS family protein [Parcubacteria group bacterium]
MNKISKYEGLYSSAEIGSGSPSCDLHGLDVDDAIVKCDSFLNSQFIKGEKVVRIIHGRGTGKLRDEIQKYLKDHELVEDFRDSQNPSEINAITIVILIER